MAETVAGTVAARRPHGAATASEDREQDREQRDPEQRDEEEQPAEAVPDGVHDGGGQGE